MEMKFYVADAELGLLPPESLLSGVKCFDPTKQDDSSKLVSHLISELKQKSETSKITHSMVTTGEGLPSLPKKCVEKILAGEFIDFAELPPAKGKVKSIPHTVEGQIVVIQAADLMESRKLIPDLATWIQPVCGRSHQQGAREGKEPTGIYVQVQPEV